MKKKIQKIIILAFLSITSMTLCMDQDDNRTYARCKSLDQINVF